MKRRARVKERRRINAHWRKKMRRALDRADYWTVPGYLLNKRKSEGRNPRVETWRERQPFTGEIVWHGNLVCHQPGVNMRITL